MIFANLLKVYELGRFNDAIKLGVLVVLGGWGKRLEALVLCLLE